jgi:hypothetical protein
MNIGGIFWIVSLSANAILFGCIVKAIWDNKRIDRDREGKRLWEEWQAHRKWMEFKKPEQEKQKETQSFL